MSTITSNFHETARDYALSGIPVFPCRPGTKTPATARGFKDATTNLDQIDLWWNENPQYNIAIEPERCGWCVVDLDPPVGEQSWAGLVAQHGDPPDTYEVSTPRKGRHLYFRGSLPSTVDKLADNIDTRGHGGYVLVPPSYVSEHDAFYDVTHDRDLALVPSWIVEALGSRREKAKALVVEQDTPAALDRTRALLRDYVKAGDVAIESKGGDARTYHLFTEIRDLGVSEEVAVSLVADHWAPHCQPYDNRMSAFLERKAENAYHFAQNDAGSSNVPSAAEVFPQALLDSLSPETARAEGRPRYYPYDEDEQDNQPEPVWLIPDLLPADATVLLYGPSGSYKSFLALHVALVLASGTPLLGYTGCVQRVVYAAAEGPRSVSRKRRPAWRVAHSIECPMEFSLINDVPRCAIPETVKQFCEAIKARQLKPRLVVIDTLARAMAGMNENDAKDAALFIEAIEYIKREFSCTVLVVHHSGKERERGARGSSALEAGFDAVYEVKANKVSKAVAIYCRKQKDADERATPWTFEGKPVASSLVFFETNSVAHAALTTVEDIFEPRKIGAALAELKAFGVDHSVPTLVLAAHLFPITSDEGSPEDHQENINRHATQLRHHAKAKLEVFTAKRGRELLWFLPAPT